MSSAGSAVWASRQRADSFTISQDLLGAAASVNSNVLRSQGHGSVLILARSDVSGTVRLFERVTGTGAEVETAAAASKADPTSGEQVVALIAPVHGIFSRVRYTNDGSVQTAFQISAYLLPSGGCCDASPGGAAAVPAGGRTFFTTHQTPGTRVTGQTAFVATTPTFMIRGAAGLRLRLLSITLYQVGTVAGDTIEFALAIDTANRFSSGGTAVIPQNPDEGDTTASRITSFLYNPVATAPGAGTRYLVNGSAAASLGLVTQQTFEEATGKRPVILNGVGTILLYTWAATAAPSWSFVFTWEEF